MDRTMDSMITAYRMVVFPFLYLFLILYYKFVLVAVPKYFFNWKRKSLNNKWESQNVDCAYLMELIKYRILKVNFKI